MDVLRNPWKPIKIHDPFLSLQFYQLPQTTPLSDRFCLPSTPSLLSPSQNHPIIPETSKQLKQSHYLNLLSKTCNVQKKKTSQNSYCSKIRRSGYMLGEEVEQILEEKNQESTRVITDKPYRILNAPKLKDDFYTNLLDWSENDIVGVVLDNAAYIWNSRESDTEKIIEGYISCLKFNKNLLIGEQTGRIRVIETERKKEICKYRSHYSRVGTIDTFGNNVFVSGSKDNNVMIWDVRSKNHVRKLEGHRQEVCGVRWSFDGNYIASGGNDNIVMVWDQRSGKIFEKFNEHTAAIKALAWSPHKNGILATGGGSTDKTIRIWNIHERSCIKRMDTGSQVCNMMYSRNSNELVSTHGFSLNSVNIWNSKTMENIGTLRGHSFRVLYLAGSPDGQSIVTGSGDQTLRFWKIFPNINNGGGGCRLETKNISIR